MTFFNFMFLVLGATVIWFVWRYKKVMEIRLQEESWLPARLQGAMLKFSEKKFFDGGLYPLVAQVDRAYQTLDGEIILVDFKRRSVKRAFESDMVEISAQRVTLLANGVTQVSRLAYVVVIDPSTDVKTPIPIQLEDEEKIRDRQRRFIAISNGKIVPSSTSAAGICRRCGHKRYCDKVVID